MKRFVRVSKLESIIGFICVVSGLASASYFYFSQSATKSAQKDSLTLKPLLQPDKQDVQMRAVASNAIDGRPHVEATPLTLKTAPQSSSSELQFTEPNTPQPLNVTPREPTAGETRAILLAEAAPSNAYAITSEPSLSSQPDRTDLVQTQEPAIKSQSVSEASEVTLASEPSKSATPTIDEDKDLIIQPKIGYGVRYFDFKQSGAFGGLNGSTLTMNVLSFETIVHYGAWNLKTGIERFSIGFSDGVASTANEEFKHFYFKPGYGIFFFGIDGQSSPIALAGTGAIQWASITSLSVVGGLRFEKWYHTQKPKPFLFGMEVEGSTPVAVSGDSASPTVSFAHGFGVVARGYLEKIFRRREEYSLSFGLDGSLSYESLQFEGNWATSSGSSTRTRLECGSKIYLGVQF